jgi:predicted RNA polymerase sigma factor
LNRAIAIAHLNGPESGLEAIRAIPHDDRLDQYPFFPAALAELELRAGKIDAAREHFRAAAALARNTKERRFLELRAEAAAH